MTGRERILDLQPKDIHERAPIYLGSKREVEKILELYQLHDASDSTDKKPAPLS